MPLALPEPSDANLARGFDPVQITVFYNLLPSLQWSGERWADTPALPDAGRVTATVNLLAF